MTMLSLGVDKLLTMARMDEDRQVVMEILDSITEMLDDIKQPVLNAVESHDVFISLIKDVFQQKVLTAVALGHWQTHSLVHAHHFHLTGFIFWSYSTLSKFPPQKNVWG